MKRSDKVEPISSNGDRRNLRTVTHPKPRDADRAMDPYPDNTDVDPVIDPDGDLDVDLWGGAGVWREFFDLVRFFWLDQREAGLSCDELERSVTASIEAAEGEFRHGKRGRMQHNDVAATFSVETVDNVNVESAKQRFERGVALAPIELKALVESGEYEIRPTESSDENRV
ncbi:hypothetical protein KTS45_10020 [Halomicroarcula limicola]|uniref:Uncharacterized protein n=1 Tax=Haloarcula limicola TaxID=1429915 RepID=A0A8J7YA70_9EURY|nr:hypothetical protein [Halomicroarcula limicola]MBV0924534.1 hypothetical protein [Halomicroarcula limicola]